MEKNRKKHEIIMLPGFYSDLTSLGEKVMKAKLPNVRRGANPGSSSCVCVYINTFVKNDEMFF